MGGPVFAGSSTTLELPRESTSTSSTGVTSLSFQNSQYLSSGEAFYQSGAARENTSVRLNANRELTFKKYGVVRGQLSDEWSATEKWNYLNINQAYVGARFKSLQISGGRKLETWAEWESTWNQGVFQPRYMQNRLHPEAAGLTGVFLSSGGENWGATLAYLLLNIPDLGAHFYTKDNHFVSKNPWFHSPASQFIFENVPTDIHYSLKSPELSYVADRPGAAGKVEYRDGGYLSRASVAYKPISQLSLGFPSQNQFINGATDSYMKIDIHPRVIYERVVNWDNKIESKDWSASGSIAYDEPANDLGPDNNTSQQFQPAWIYSGRVEHGLEESGPRATRVEAGFLKIAGGDARDSGRFAGSTSLFERRFQYQEAYYLGLTMDLRGQTRYPLENHVRVTYDRLQNGAVFSFNSGMFVNENWHADFSAEFLGLVSSQSAQVSDGFLSSYRANDRVGLGLSYVY